MTGYVQFFSVVIQASAGILGIIVALATVIHTLGIQKRTPRSQQFHSELVDLSEEYRSAFQGVSGLLITELPNNHYQSMLKDYSVCEEIIENPDKYDLGESLQAHVYRIEYLLSPTQIRDFHTITQEQLDAISDSADWLLKQPQSSGSADRLYEEIEGHPPGHTYLYEDILPDVRQLDLWMDSRDNPASAKTLHGLQTLFTAFASDAISKISTGRPETIADYKSPLQNNKYKCALIVLAIFGIIIPLLFLFWTPDPFLVLSSTKILVSQILVFALSALSAGYLFYKLWTI